MSKLTKAQLAEQVAHLQARLAKATEVHRAQRAEIEQLQAQLAGPRRAPCTPRGPAPSVITQYTDRFGRRWEKTRVGNHASLRLLHDPNAEAEPAGA